MIDHCRVDLQDVRTALRIPRFEAPLIAVALKGKRVGRVIRAPYRLELPPGGQGEFRLDLTCFGDRINTFGPLHNCNPREYNWGPKAARTVAEDWTDGNVFRAKGVCVAPVVEQACASST